jgi:hypothetical protein
MNLPKTKIGSTELSYLGLRLTPQGITSGEDHHKAIQHTLPPSSIQEIRQFLHMFNFYWKHVRNCAQTATPLNTLTWQDHPWKGGTLPDDAL